MAPSGTSSCVLSQLRQLIFYHIDNNLLSNALFFAERLTAYDRSSESTYLLALCHLRLGDNASAYEYTKQAGARGAHFGCAYVFAQTCLALSKFKEGITALEKSKVHWGGRNNFGKHTASARQPLPDAAVVLCLLGKLYYGYDNKSKAIGAFEESLKLNPFMWDAFTCLCDAGVNVRVTNVFKLTPEMEAVLKIPSDTSDSSSSSRETVCTVADQDRNRNARPASVTADAADPFNNVSSRGGVANGLFSSLGGITQKLSESNPSLTNLPAAGGGGIGPEAMETPTGPSASIDTVHARREPGVVSAYTTEPPHAPSRKSRAIPGLGMDFNMDAPKINRAVSSKRSHRPLPEPIEDGVGTQPVRLNSLAVPAGERKRTVSGQVVRQGSEDPGAPQRRSIRLQDQGRRPTSSKVPTTLPSFGPPPGRELKKARPPISKIIRSIASGSTAGRQVSGNRRPVDDSMELDQREGEREAPSLRSWTGSVSGIPSQKLSSTSDFSRQQEAVKQLLDLFARIGSGYFALSKFLCMEALEIYKSLPKVHLDTPWIMAQMGRAYYEQAAYADAEKYYKRIRQIAPSRFEDMEIYSTILWFLKRETDLAFLAHELIDASWQSPQAWCALGNSWSLAGDHEQALRCFKRATQLKPKFAYAFTLQGHEHVTNEEYDKALVSYRSGMAADKRHYNAWYGVGRVYEKLGNYEKAFAHFSAASSINPTNAVLICCIGTVLEKQKQPRQALAYFSRATDLAPRSALTRFKKARTLMAIGDMQSALEELTILKDIAPEEAMVHFLLGRLYKALKEKGLAVRHFTNALNLDPKASQQIKEAIEQLEDSDADDEQSMLG